MRVIKLNNDNLIVAVKYVKDDYSLDDDEQISTYGELGQIMQPDGTFITPEPTPTEPIETIEQKLERLELQIQNDNLVQLEVLATIFEELMMNGSV